MSGPTQQSLDQRRSMALEIFREIVSGDAPNAAQVRVRRDRISLSLSDGSEALIHVASHKAGLATGEFEPFPTLMICGGPIRAVINSLDLDPGGGFDDEQVLVATLEVNGGRRDTFAFRHGTDVRRQARRMSLAIHRRFNPLLNAFSGDYSQAARFVLAEPRWVALPWCTAMTLFELARDESEAADLLTRAEADPAAFPDLGRISDPAATAAWIRQRVREQVGS